MNEVQKRALELWLSSASLVNNFEPLSGRELVRRLKAEGYEASSSACHRWRQKYEWDSMLSSAKLSAVSSESTLGVIVKDTPLEAVVKNTEVDVRRNGVLIASAYQALEIIMGRYLRRLGEGDELTKDEKGDVIKIAALSSDRHDRMMEMLANMPQQSLSSRELLAELQGIKNEFEEGVEIKNTEVVVQGDGSCWVGDELTGENNQYEGNEYGK
jgi:translation initiation factor 1 (eIF-1/SUI1)